MRIALCLFEVLCASENSKGFQAFNFLPFLKQKTPNEENLTEI